MSQVIFGTGLQIYKAAVEGANAGYNRSTDQHSKYESLLQRHYEYMLANVNSSKTRKNIKRNTGNSWRKAYLPLALALIHTHKAGILCEAHARVYLTSNPSAVFDIPMADWNNLKRQSEFLLSR